MIAQRPNSQTGCFLSLLLLLALSQAAWSADCTPGRIELHTQAEIDAFQANHGPCDRVELDLIIESFEIKNLHGLNGLREIGGDLLIENSQMMIDLEGLNALEHIGEDLTIFHNNGLAGLDGLDRLRSVGGHLAVFANPEQKNIDALAAVETVGGFLGVTDLHSLEQVEGLVSLQHVGSHLIVVFNHNLQRLDGLDNLAHVGGYVRVKLNPWLHSCIGLGRLLDEADDVEPGPGAGSVPDVGGIIEFQNNLPGCNGIEEIRTADSLELNPSLGGAWFDPGTPGQGMFLTVWPTARQALLGWFTFDRDRPLEGAAFLGDPGHRWLTGFGGYSENRATLNLEVTRGGLFDAIKPVPMSESVGEGVLEFSSCETAALSYSLPAADLQGVIPLRRISALEECP